MRIMRKDTVMISKSQDIIRRANIDAIEDVKKLYENATTLDQLIEDIESVINERDRIISNF